MGAPVLEHGQDTLYLEKKNGGLVIAPQMI